MKGILGTKIGMTQVFTKDGKLIPVTVVKVEPNVVTQVKTVEKDGYDAIQIATQTVRTKVSNKPKMGHTKKANTEPKRFLREIRGVNVSEYTLGQVIKADFFEKGEIVDVTGTSKGKGFQGVVKRHNYSKGPMSHGSRFHRGVGSLGSIRAKRVFKGKKMPGQLGNETVTIQNLEIIDFDLDENILLVKGNTPGSKKSLLIIKSAVKAHGKKYDPEELVVYEIEEEVKDVVEEQVVEETPQVEEVKETVKAEEEVIKEVKEEKKETEEVKEETNEA